ncbi:2-isopropylmalate synthase/homocitrate synthase family protein [Pyrolobus fumarii 1A]|uniref:Citramalate synthase n=1 Tax=Pyrolobus fumarii (strain DSM 11204 / 1A) TaxID=694429 RepID=G0EFS1_PYRF1|nr:citramalate synthase [Pyrolobus fumarii]AEM38242.1 2-isopropylmalate synthase/homocitrate synthase family protein [Pyrolobus fumarii 1A]
MKFKARLPKEVEVLDSTLREGSQARGVSFDVQGKVRIALELDRLGVAFIEGGWPGSNPKDDEFFRVVREYSLEHAELVAFTSTRRKGVRAEDDPMLSKVLEAGTKWVTVFGKSWDLHVREVLRTSLEENLEMIYDTIRFFREHGIRVIFDAEHFFDGFRENREYALKVLETALEAGAERLVLADTNGGMLPHQVYAVVSEIVEKFGSRAVIGLHMHNDSGNAVANTLMGVLAGARHVQVTVNGIGERTGNADLCVVVPNLELKMNIRALRNPEGLRLLKRLSRLVYDLAGLEPNPYQPYVGDYAFAHKAGVHIDAVLKNPRAYEHIDPELVGNERRLTVSELSGAANLVAWAREELGLKLDKNDPAVRRALERIKRLEKEGYSFENAVATALLILLEELGLRGKPFEVRLWRVMSGGEEWGSAKSWAVVKLARGDREELAAGEGGGPVHAIDEALRGALSRLLPEAGDIRLIDYRVHLPIASKHTASEVRVEITFTDGKRTWTTTAISQNIIEASLKALVEGFEYHLLRRRLRGE